MRGALVVAVLSACGGSNTSRPDADLGDAAPSDGFEDRDADDRPDALDSVDAESPDVPIHARITVELGGQVSVGERILINRRDGSLVGEGATDAAGVFDTTMPDGGSLTWVRVDLPIKSFHTYTDLHDGDLVNTGTLPPPPTGTVTPISITRTQIPNAMYTKFGVDRFPDQTFSGTTFSYPSTATGTVTVIQDGLDMFQTSVGYSKTTVTVAPGATVTMPSTIHQGLDLVVDVVAPVLEGATITATVVPFQSVGASTSRQEHADTTGAVSIRFPRFVYSEIAYLSSLSVYLETIGLGNENHFTHYMIDSSITRASYGIADLAECPKSVSYDGSRVTIGQPPSHADFARYTVGRWNVMVPYATTSFVRIVVPPDLFAEFTYDQVPLMATTIDSGDIDYRTALSLQRSTHYSRSAYTGDGHPFMRECWRFPPSSR